MKLIFIRIVSFLNYRWHYNVFVVLLLLSLEKFSFSFEIVEFSFIFRILRYFNGIRLNKPESVASLTWSLKLIAFTWRNFPTENFPASDNLSRHFPAIFTLRTSSQWGMRVDFNVFCSAPARRRILSWYFIRIDFLYRLETCDRRFKQNSHKYIRHDVLPYQQLLTTLKTHMNICSKIVNLRLIFLIFSNVYTHTCNS